MDRRLDPGGDRPRTPEPAVQRAAGGPERAARGQLVAARVQPVVYLLLALGIVVAAPLLLARGLGRAAADAD
jgi:hypothetical protein